MKLTNFKSWKSADISMGQITGLFGTNSSGKTSLIQFLLLLKQTMLATDRNVALDLNGPYVELGTMADVLFKHEERNRLTFQLDIQLTHPMEIVDTAASRTAAMVKSDDFRLAAGIVSQNQAPKGDMLAYRLGDAMFWLDRSEKEKSKFRLRSSGVDDFKFTRTPGRVWNLPGPMKAYQFPDQARTYFQNAGFLADLEFNLEENLDNLYYLGPLREDPRRDYTWTRSTPNDVGERGEHAIEAIISAQDRGETRNLKPKGRRKPFSEMIAYWLKEMGLIYSFKVVEIAPGSNRWQAKVRTHRNSSEVLLTDVGFGVSQVLPVITLLYYAPENSTVILEQPEIHLHPLAQASLADVIINAATHRHIQVIVESHSEHLLLRLQRRIAEETISSEDVKLYFCDASKGFSTAEPLRLDLLGNIENWPDKFMGDAFTETAKAELARIKRSARSKT
ncbi:DUF3696 domain-containing protein [Arenibacterium halophilum]|uniref:DUF3696 domain-containing protein n=1 Tax=Arenibacterium halophilum TaxID=2583821 RepID=UPI001AEDCDF6|nr:DUF3696 domain-containing protein [Arenibacterium halophilum]